MVIIENVEEISNRNYSVKLKIVNGIDAVPFFKDYKNIAASTIEEAKNNAFKLYKLEVSEK